MNYCFLLAARLSLGCLLLMMLPLADSHLPVIILTPIRNTVHQFLEPRFCAQGSASLPLLERGQMQSALPEGMAQKAPLY